MADMDGDRVGIEGPVPEQAGKADGHILSMLSNGVPPLSLSWIQFSLGTISLSTARSAVRLRRRKAATSSLVMESNTWGKRKGS